MRKLAIERGNERLVFERRGQGMGRWQMVEPKDVAAEPTRLETLVRNLKELRRSLDSGSVAGDPDAFGLGPPVATISLWAETAPGDGGANRRRRSRRWPWARRCAAIAMFGPGGTDVIEVADSKLFSAVDLPVIRVARAGRDGRPDVSGRVIDHQTSRQGHQRRARRTGRWRLTAPVHAPANPAKIESLLSALSSLRVVDGEKGFAADNVTDFAPFGLAQSGSDSRAGDHPTSGRAAVS